MAVEYQDLPFEEAIAFFRNKVNMPGTRWTDVWKEAHDSAFMVAGAAKADLLNDLRGAVDEAISQGTTLEAFRERFDETVARTGWEYRGGRGWRTRVIYETNLRTAYAAGRHAQLTDPDLLRVRPYWQYLHGGSADPREEHLAWDKMVLHADDPWWREHYPPNGWGCSCKVVAKGPADLERMGKEGPDTAPTVKREPWQDTTGARQEDVPEGVDPGFNYPPGKSVAARTREAVERKRSQLPDVLATAMMAEIRAALGDDPDPLEE
ncbi:phage minor head protein [Halomonas saccharevitans]|uniref:Phage Mu protein F like protein n=1 Tax=Halomonas saccharevitans TaxID=416872 RepID=A0A1I7AG58_9GAMM|nr:phage minor head protein [Halomonas saccharevitans]SFT73929.1 Phage Mu protein F like protein [Halomonas saccharevitans]